MRDHTTVLPQPVRDDASANPASSLSAQGLVALAEYRRRVRRRLWLLASFAGAIVIAACFDLAIGPSGLPVADAVRALFGIGATDPVATVIVWQLRLPYAVMALLVGTALSLAGAEIQTTLNNPLASPFTLGMASAAILGAALVIILGGSFQGLSQDWLISLSAFAFALGSVLLLNVVSQRRRTGAETVVLFGIALFFTFNAFVAILQFVAGEQTLQQLVFWTMGSLGRADWTKVTLLAIVLFATMPFSFRTSWALTALRLGDERAHSSGLDVRRLRRWSLIRVSLLTGAAVAFVGTIAFVGLVGPHIARLLVGEDHRFFLPASALAGALLMSCASLASKTLVPGAVLPIGLVTALIGVPFFVSLLFSRRPWLT
jgi:iron complex transport system permease protein